MRWASELSFAEGSRHWQEQVSQLQRQMDFSTSMCQTLLQDQQVGPLHKPQESTETCCVQAQSEGRTHQHQSKVCMFYYALFLQNSIFYYSHGNYEIVLGTSCSETLYLLSQNLSYMLQTLLTGQYSILPNNLSSPQVHLVMHQLNQCYTQLAWQQNNIQR